MHIWIYGYMDIWTYGHMDIWTYGHMDIWTYGHMDIWTYGYMDIWMYGHQLTPNACNPSSTPLHLYTYTSAPLLLYLCSPAPLPLHLCTSYHLYLYLYCHATREFMSSFLVFDQKPGYCNMNKLVGAERLYTMAILHYYHQKHQSWRLLIDADENARAGYVQQPQGHPNRQVFPGSPCRMHLCIYVSMHLCIPTHPHTSPHTPIHPHTPPYIPMHLCNFASVHLPVLYATAVLTLSIPISTIPPPLDFIICQISNIQYPISNIKYPISNIQYQISNIQYPISNIQYPISNIQAPIIPPCWEEIVARNRQEQANDIIVTASP
jgi:hypothetical protein